MAAPAVEVMPGNHPVTLPVSTPLIPCTGETGSLSSSVCGGRSVLRSAVRREGMPKSPVSRGNMVSGSKSNMLLMGRMPIITISPAAEESAVMAVAAILLPGFSSKIISASTTSSAPTVMLSR